MVLLKNIKIMITLVFDTETTGFTKPNGSYLDQPRIVQLGALLFNERHIITQLNVVIRPDNFLVPVAASDVHGITTDIAKTNGIDIRAVLEVFKNLSQLAETLVCYNVPYDKLVLNSEFQRANLGLPFQINHKWADPMFELTPICKLPSPKYPGKYKWPKLKEAIKYVFNEDFEADAHDALADVKATARLHWWLEDRKLKQQEIPQIA